MRATAVPLHFNKVCGNAFQYHHGIECLADLSGQFRMFVLKYAFLNEACFFFLLGDLMIHGLSHFQAAFRIFVSKHS